MAPQGNYPYNWQLENEINRDNRYALKCLQDVYEMLRVMEATHKGRSDWNTQQRYMYHTPNIIDPVQYTQAMNQTIQTYKVPEIREVIEYIEVILGVRPAKADPSLMGITPALPEVDEAKLRLVIREEGGVIFEGDQHEFTKEFCEYEGEAAAEAFCRDNGWTLEVTPW
jgi:hypothetical protein